MSRPITRTIGPRGCVFLLAAVGPGVYKRAQDGCVSAMSGTKLAAGRFRFSQGFP